MVAAVIASAAVERGDLENSVRQFLRQLAAQLVVDDPSRAVAAAEHGEQRFQIGFHVAAMTREYGLLLQAIEAVAVERGLDLTMGEFGALARFVVAGVAEATTAFVEQERSNRERDASRHFAFIAHEMRHPIQTMSLALDAWDLGLDPLRVQASLRRALEAVREVIDGSLIEAQRTAGAEVLPRPRIERFDLASLLASIVEANRPHGEARSVSLASEAPDTLVVELDRGLVRSVLTNLIRNGIKFSHADGQVTVRLARADDRVHIEVQDSCGGLPEGAIQTMFRPFTQMSADRTGFGLGLAITRQAIDALGGHVQVHDAQQGCVFVVDLPLVFVSAG